MSKRHGRMLEVNGTNDSLVPFSFLQFRLTNLPQILTKLDQFTHMEERTQMV